MTSNQIAYWQNVERERADKAAEAEKYRANKQQEYLKAKSIEQERYLAAKERELREKLKNKELSHDARMHLLDQLGDIRHEWWQTGQNLSSQAGDIAETILGGAMKAMF